MSDDGYDFTSVPRQSNRHDGRTEEKQRQFIDAPAHFGVVRAAAEKVGMGVVGAYRLREAQGAESFADAWDRALKIGASSLADIAMDRAVNGVAVPKFYKGEQVGEGRWFDNRLLMFMMKQTLSRRYGPHAAEHDFVDESLAAERATRERTREKLTHAQDLLDSFHELINDQDMPGTEKLPAQEPHKLSDCRDRLEALVDRLTTADPEGALETYSPLALPPKDPRLQAEERKLAELVEQIRARQAREGAAL